MARLDGWSVHQQQGIIMYKIDHTWDGDVIDHQPATINISYATNNQTQSAVQIDIVAPFFNDPGKPPNGVAGQSYDELWNYEVVETFFLNDENEYLELEYGPHGQYLVLLISSKGEKCLGYELEYRAEVSADSGQWTGTALVPAQYFPPNVTRFNAYAIHGGGRAERRYEALYPATKGRHAEPNFHRLEYFQPIANFSTILPQNADAVSKEWSAVRVGRGRDTN